MGCSSRHVFDLTGTGFRTLSNIPPEIASDLQRARQVLAIDEEHIESPVYVVDVLQ